MRSCFLPCGLSFSAELAASPGGRRRAPPAALYFALRVAEPRAAPACARDTLQSSARRTPPSISIVRTWHAVLPVRELLCRMRDALRCGSSNSPRELVIARRGKPSSRISHDFLLVILRRSRRRSGSREDAHRRAGIGLERRIGSMSCGRTLRKTFHFPLASRHREHLLRRRRS